MRVNFHDRKLLVASFLAVFLIGLVGGTALVHQNYVMQARESFAYQNPVTVDLWKRAPDNSLVPAGWLYLGLEAQGYHYQFQSHNKIMNAGQNWMGSLLPGLGGAGKISYIALGTNAVAPSATDVSLIGGELAADLARAQAAYTAKGAAAGGTVTWTLVHTFTATAAVNSVQIAGLFTTTGANSPIIFAETTFAAVNLASGDTLTLTWTLSSGGN